jgi:hypothetical protein
MSFLAGVLLLVALDATTSSAAAAGRFTGALALIPKLVAWVVDPNVPGIPNRVAVTQKAA